jgi:hypothetical protein
VAVNGSRQSGDRRAFVEKERPDWLQALMPRRINAPSDYWPQKVLALATIQAAISNQLMKDAGLKLDPTFGVVEGQTGHLLQFDVRTFYVSKELLAAAARTGLPTDIFMDASIPFPRISFYVTESHDSSSYGTRMPLHRCLTRSKGTGLSASTQGHHHCNNRRR